MASRTRLRTSAWSAGGCDPRPFILDRSQRVVSEKINGDLSKLNGPEFEQFLESLDDVNIEIDDGKAQVRITAE